MGIRSSGVKYLIAFSFLVLGKFIHISNNRHTIFPISTGVNAAIQFPHDIEQCLGQLVEYQCTVDAVLLNWRVFDNNQAQLSDGFADYGSGGIGPTNTIGGGVFTVEQLQQSPIVSTISFTVQSSISGYTIVCEDGVAMTNENVTINIPGMTMKIMIM